MFVEDLCEYLYHTDRMLFNLKRNGVFDKLAGLIIGEFTNMKDSPTPFGKPVEEMIFDYKEIKNHAMKFDNTVFKKKILNLNSSSYLVNIILENGQVYNKKVVFN